MDDYNDYTRSLVLYRSWKQAPGCRFSRVLTGSAVCCLGGHVLAAGRCRPKLAGAEERAGLVHRASV